MDCPKAPRATEMGLAFLFVSGLFMSLVFAQGNKQVESDWRQIRKAFDTYFSSPTEGNAERVLSVLPNRFYDKMIDFSAMNSTIIGIYNDHIKDLYILVKKGDRLALRIAFDLRKFTDGFYAGQMTALIGDSIVVMPTVFLEEALFFRKNNPGGTNDYRFYTKDEFLDQILYGYIDFDSFRPDVIEKEIQSRMKALESVDRKDLLEFRNYCLRRLSDHLKTLRRRAPDCSKETKREM